MCNTAWGCWPFWFCSPDNTRRLQAWSHWFSKQQGKFQPLWTDNQRISRAGKLLPGGNLFLEMLEMFQAHNVYQPHITCGCPSWPWKISLAAPPFQESQHYLQVQACTGFREFLPHLTHHGKSKARMETGALALHPFFNHLIMLSSETVSLHWRPLMRTFLFFQERKMKLRTGKEWAGNCKLPQWVLKLSFQATSICQQPLFFFFF